MLSAHTAGPLIAETAAGDQRAWLERFRAGDRVVLGQLYLDHFASVARATDVLANEADRETIIQDVFLRLISDAGVRASYRGGDMGSWLAAIARHLAIDYLRRRKHEAPSGSVPEGARAWSCASLDTAADSRLLVERFRRDVLPAKWAAVFEARFIRQLNQAEAAAELHIARTTLAYQEARVRRLLRRFFLKDARP